MRISHTKRIKAKKTTPQEDPIFYIIYSKRRLPKSLLLKLREMKKRARGKIPILVIDNKEQRMKVELKPITRREAKIRKLQGIDLVSIGLEHLLTCKRRYL